MGHEGKLVVLPAEGVENIDGTFTGSEFLHYVGIKLRVFGGSSQKRFLVFQNEEDEEDDEIDSTIIRSGSPPPRTDNRVIIENQIRRALEHVDLAKSISILVQFWAPVTMDGRRYLQTFSQPFGMTYLAKGLCSYRKLSCWCLHSCTLKSTNTNGDRDEGRESRLILTGPPSRVFSNGMPEYSPDVEFYSTKEYPQRDHAVYRKVKNYMGVPVFGPSAQQCIGVLELLSTLSDTKRPSMEEMNKPAYVFGLMSTALQGVGLRTSTFASQLAMEKNSAKSSIGRSSALDNIWMALKEACMIHSLPFAQTWTTTEHKTCTPYVLSTSDEYYQSRLEYSIFRDTCESFHLMLGEGVVWKAFGSGGSCFCRDIGQLSIADYSFSHVARKARLTTSFAICLKSHHDTGDPDVYVLELFLPHETANPQQLLELVLLTMRRNLDGFRIGSGKKLGSEMDVQVLKVAEDDKVEFFKLFPSSASGSVGLLDQDSLMHEEPTLNRQRHLDNAETIFSDSMESLNCEWLLARDTSVSTSVSMGWREEHSSDTRSVKEPGSSYNTSSISTSRFPDKDYMVENQDAIGWSIVGRDADFSETKKTKSSALAGQQKISRETIEKHFGLKLKEAASSLQVSPATLKRKCRKAGIPCWPRKKSNGNCSNASIDSNKENEMSKRKCEDNLWQSVASALKVATSRQLPSPQVATLPMSDFMTIKAQYGAYTIVKFKLPLSSPLLQMEREVASRLKLEMGNFKIWYRDEDDEYVLLTCDEDLRTMESMEKSTVRVCITSGDSAPG